MRSAKISLPNVYSSPVSEALNVNEFLNSEISQTRSNGKFMLTLPKQSK
jgi:hypothetical protein